MDARAVRPHFASSAIRTFVFQPRLAGSNVAAISLTASKRWVAELKKEKSQADVAA
jgi:hypothetical protein